MNKFKKIIIINKLPQKNLKKSNKVSLVFQAIISVGYLFPKDRTEKKEAIHNFKTTFSFLRVHKFLFFVCSNGLFDFNDLF